MLPGRFPMRWRTTTSHAFLCGWWKGAPTSDMPTSRTSREPRPMEPVCGRWKVLWIDYCKQDSEIENIMHFTERPILLRPELRLLPGRRVAVAVVRRIRRRGSDGSARRALPVRSRWTSYGRRDIRFVQQARPGKCVRGVQCPSIHSFTGSPISRTSPTTTATRSQRQPRYLSMKEYPVRWTTGSTATSSSSALAKGSNTGYSVTHGTLRPTSLWVYDSHGGGQSRVDVERGYMAYRTHGWRGPGALDSPTTVFRQSRLPLLLCRRGELRRENRPLYPHGHPRRVISSARLRFPPSQE